MSERPGTDPAATNDPLAPDTVPGAALAPTPTPPADRNARRLLWLLLATAVALLVAGFAYWRLVPDAPPPPPLPAAQPPPAAPLTLETGLPRARAQADRWLPGARLLNASMQIDWPWTATASAPLALPDGGWLSFAFVAPWSAPGRNDRAASLGLVIERVSGQIVQQTTLGWETAPAIPAATPPARLSSAAAALAAEAAGGAAFRAACPEQRHVSRVLRSTAAGYPPHWLVVYEDARQPERHGFLVRIDAATGELLQTREDAPACPE